MLHRSLYHCYTNLHPSPSHTQALRSFSLWSMKKDPDLEKALSRNRRWIVNNQIKNILLRCPNQVLPVSHLQKKFKSLDLQGKALNWLKKYPNCFQIYFHNKEYHCRLTKQVIDLVEEEESVKRMQEPVFVDRLAKILLMSVNHRLNLIKLNEFKRSFGFPDDYLGRVLSKNPEMFRLVNGKEIELVSCDHHHRLAVSAIEATAMKTGSNPCYRCSLPESWIKMRERFDEFNSTPYVSPYSDTKSLARDPSSIEKRVVGVVHELLSLSLWKKMSIVKLEHFRREFGFPEKLNVLLMKHPGVFYVTNKYKVCTVVLREGYRGSELVEKDELVVVKERFGELMQGGYGGGERRRLVKERCDGDDKNSEEDGEEDKKFGLFDPEERKRFYDILLGDDDDDDPRD